MATQIKMKTTRAIKKRLGIDYGGEVHKVFTASYARHMDPYVPMDTGTLAETVIVGGQPTRNVTADTITYATPYASYVYYGLSKNGKKINYHTDKHALAGPYWDKRMWATNKRNITKEVQDYVDRRK